MNIDLVLWIVAAILFILAGFRVATPRVDLGWFGLAAAALTFIV